MPQEGQSVFKEPAGMYGGESKDEINLSLKFPSGLAFRVYDDFDEKAITKREDGSFLVEATFPGGDWLFDYLLSFGAEVEVLGPPQIRGRMRAMAEKIMRKHADKT